ncbi:MAG: hypothetical protein KIC60_06000 [Clostridium sp.]|nr:hypothetical protein [Clostridium sp.]
MKYSGDLIKLNGKSFKSIISYKLGRNKLWSSDTGRNMAGSMKGSLVGNFPKIMLEIEPLDAEEMSELELILDSASIEVEYYNNKYKCTCTADFYANDYEEDLLLRTEMKYKSFSVNLIPNEREDKHVKNT